jgi:hypothetical protein
VRLRKPLRRGSLKQQRRKPGVAVVKPPTRVMPGRRSGGLRRSGHGTWARGSGGKGTREGAASDVRELMRRGDGGLVTL